MCGFLGEFTFNKSDLISENSFSELLALSKHRGPDATEIVRKDNFQLGFNRLAILDVSANGNQPKCSPSKRYHIVFNGEIYNFKELINQYQLKNLMSNSDTEVIIHLLDILGVKETIKVLNGMFAIAIVDTQKEVLYLTRDFAGIKPLFYGVSDQGIVAASQFDQIFKHEWFNGSLQLRADTVKEYFGFGYMQAPNTIYKNIFQIVPGTLISYNIKGDFKSEIICQFNSKLDASKAKKPIKELEKTLKQVVKRQMISDLPLATFLSGGIDSPIISSYAQKNSPSIEAFTLEVNDEKLNESEIAKDYAKHLKMAQQIISADEKDILNIIDEHFEAYSEPFGDYSSIPTYLITKEAKKQYTVMLSGDGGDELFLGYPRMLDVLRKRNWFKIPYLVRKSLVRVTNKLKVTNTWTPFIETFNDFIKSKHTQIPKEYLDKMFAEIDYSKELNELYAISNNQTNLQLLHQLRHNEFYAHLQRVLIKVDRASMKNSLEVRVPLLDKDIITHAWGKVNMLHSKRDLKKDLKKILALEIPESLINQKKMGFSVPLFNWLHNELKESVYKLIFDTSFYGENVINVVEVKQYVQDFYDGKHEDTWGVWHIYAWQRWATDYVFSDK